MPGRLRRLVIATHRWLGTFFCVLFAIWFFSGTVLAYWDYPGVSDRDRLEHAEAIDISRVRLTPRQAYSKLQLDGEPASEILLMFDGRPAYRFDGALVYADTGEPQTDFPPELTRRIAGNWISRPAGAASLGVVDQPDQWTVSGEFGPLRPLDKYSWPDGAQIYVSEVTGEVVQATTRASRLGAWLGAIPHWLYFTPLRENGRLWSRIVIWAAGIGAFAAALGLIVGIWIALPARRVPYAGQKRWHAMLGLIFGLFACTWAFSGMLSMEPFAFSAGPERLAAQIELTLHGNGFKTLEQAYKPGAKLVDFNALDGEPEGILAAVREAVAPASINETRLVTKYEAYYLDRHTSGQNQHPLPVLFVHLNDPRDSMFYIDPATAHIIEAYDSASRWNRWLYHGLHSLDFPWLYAHRPAWDIVILVLLGGGAALSITSLVLAWRVLGRTLALKWRRAQS